MIRLMEEKDLKQILEMEEVLFPGSPWTEEMFQYELNENPFSKVYVLEEDNMIIAYADLWIIYEQAQLSNIAVRKDYQHKGYGQMMLDYCINEAIHAGCETISLEVRITNEKAIVLYEKNGFIKVGIREKYYEDGTDAHLMVKPIGGLIDDEDISD